MLTGDRVVLRPIDKADLPRLWQLVEDFEVALLVRDGPIVPLSLAEFEAQHDERLTKKDEEFRFAIEVDGDLIGMCGLNAIDYFNRRCELGIGIGKDFWAKGFGQDAVRTMVDYAFEHLNMNRVALYVSAEEPRAWARTSRRGSSRRGACVRIFGREAASTTSS